MRGFKNINRWSVIAVDPLADAAADGIVIVMYSLCVIAGR